MKRLLIQYGFDKHFPESQVFLLRWLKSLHQSDFHGANLLYPMLWMTLKYHVCNESPVKKPASASWKILIIS